MSDVPPMSTERPTQPGRFWYDRHDGFQAQCVIVLKHHKKLRKGRKALVVETDEGHFLLSDLHGWLWAPVV